MGFLTGKKLLITGVLSNRSIAYGIARACQREGAELAFSYVGERFKDRITEFAAEFGSNLVFDCDVGDDAQIDALFADLSATWPKFDGFVHAIGFAPREAIAGDFLEGLSREAFRIAHDISAYSFPAMAKAALPYLQRQVGAADADLPGRDARRARTTTRWAWPRRRSKLACATWPARSGPKGIRVNGISAGPIKTLARQRHQGLRQDPRRRRATTAPLRRNVTIEDVGNVAAFLLTDLAGGVTAEITYVDGGFSHTAMRAAESSAPHARRRRAASAGALIHVRARRVARLHAVHEVAQLAVRPRPPPRRPWMSVSKPGNPSLKSRANCRYSTIGLLKRSPGISSGMPGGYGVSSDAS